MYISKLEIEKLRQLSQKISNEIKVEISFQETIKTYIPNNEILEEMLEKGEILEKVENLSTEVAKNELFSQLTRHLNDSFIQDKVYLLDDLLFLIFTEELRIYLHDSINKYHNNYNNIKRILKNYNDDLTLLLKNIEVNELAKFIRMIGKLFDKEEFDKKERGYYIYKDSQRYIIRVGEAAEIFKKSCFNEEDIKSFTKIIEDTPLKFLIEFKREIYIDEKEKRISSTSCKTCKKIENVYLLSIDLDKGTLFEVISYLYVRKILNEVGLLFLSTHNLLLEWKENENINHREIDIPIILFYGNKPIFITIECKFTSPDEEDIRKLTKMKETLNNVPVHNEVCIFTADSDITLDKGGNIHVVPILKLKEWIKELLIKKF